MGVADTSQLSALMQTQITDENELRFSKQYKHTSLKNSIVQEKISLVFLANIQYKYMLSKYFLHGKRVDLPFLLF